MSLIGTAVMAFCGAATYDVLRLVGAKAYAWLRGEISDYIVHRKCEKSWRKARVLHESVRGELFDPIQECCGAPISRCTCLVNEPAIGRCVR